MIKWEDYFQPGTDQKVLKNKLGITDQKKLENAERQIVKKKRPLKNAPLTFEGLKKIHHQLFADIYDWAGETRQVNMMKEGKPFTNHRNIEKEATALFADLKSDNYYQGLSQQEFIEKASDFFGKLNDLHPFREGNGRAQRLMIQQLGKQAGHQIDFSQITKERMIDASIQFRDGNKDEMRSVFNDSINTRDKAILKEFNDFFKENRGVENWNNQNISTAKQGIQYSGTFIGKGKAGFTMQLDNNKIIVSHNEYLKTSPTPGSNFTFQYSERKEIKEQVVEHLKKSKLSDSTKDKIIKRLETKEKSASKAKVKNHDKER